MPTLKLIVSKFDEKFIVFNIVLLMYLACLFSKEVFYEQCMDCDSDLYRFTPVDYMCIVFHRSLQRYVFLI